MRQRVYIFSYILSLCAVPAVASDFIDTEAIDTDTEQIQIIEENAPKTYWIDEAQQNPNVLGNQNYYGDVLYITNNFNYISGNNGYGDGINYGLCPFNTAIECSIWHKKPLYSQSVAPRSAHLSQKSMAQIVDAVSYDIDISANNPDMAPLVERYKMLMRASGSCCTVGATYTMRTNDMSDGYIYKFLSDDANFYGFTNRCLVMNNDDIDAIDNGEIDTPDLMNIRDGCLCRARQWFDAMLTPFVDLYQEVPEFASSDFVYTYTDGVGRQVSVSINQDIQTTLEMLKQCP
ncbi:MAG: hypothetical protein ACLRFI_01655 [Alphaproteobacteria bacterium]